MSRAVLAVALLQALLLAAALPGGAILLREPIRSVDYTGHYYVIVHMAEHWRRVGAFWGYDPYWMIGYPDGLFGLIDAKLWYPFILAAPRGYEPLAFNAGILLALLGVPWAIWAAARAAGASPRESVCAMLAATAATFAVPLTGFFWAGGAIWFVLASALAVPATVLLSSALADGAIAGRGGGRALGLGFFVAAVHPGVLPQLAIGSLAGVWGTRAGRGAILRGLAVVAAVLFVPLMPLLFALAELWSQIRPTPGTGFLAGGVRALAAEWSTHFLHTEPGWMGGPGGLLALLVLAGAGSTCGARSREDLSFHHAPAMRAIGAASAACGLLAVASSVLPSLAVIQPQRYLVTLAFFLCIPAGRGTAWVLGGGGQRRLVGAAAVTMAMLFIGEAGYALWPPPALGHGVDETEDLVVAYLQQATTEEDRILVESAWHEIPAAPGSRRSIHVKRFALLPLRLEREFLGNASLTPLTVQRYAAFGYGRLFGYDLARLSAGELTSLLRRYGISWVVGYRPETVTALRQVAGVFEAPARVGDCWVFRVRDPDRSRLLEGRAQVHTELDRVDVRGSSGERLVLKYHWMPTLRTDPPVPIEEAPQRGAPVGFIAVSPGGRSDFTIRQGQPRGEWLSRLRELVPSFPFSCAPRWAR